MPAVSPSVVCALDALLRAADPSDLVSPTGARRAHVRTHDGKPDRFDTVLAVLVRQRLEQRRAELAGPIDEGRS